MKNLENDPVGYIDTELVQSGFFSSKESRHQAI